MNLTKLQTFITLSECLNFTEAAEQLYCSQPAVSMQIQSLERDLGFPLFDRIGKRLYLTKQGEHFKPYAEQMINLFSTSKEHIKQLDNLAFGTLSFGASNFVGVYLLPAILSDFNKKFPGIKINMNITNSRHLINLLESNKVELLVLSNQIPIDETRFQTKTFYQDELVLIVNNQHRLAEKEVCRLEDLVTETMILKPNKSATRTYLEGEFKKYGFSSPKYMEISSLEAIKQSVIHGLGVSIVSSLAIKQEINNGSLVEVPIDGVKFLRGISYVYHRGIHLSPATKELISLLNQKPDSTVQLRLLETTDLHGFLANYDYYQTKQDDKVGLVKTATLIKQARNEVENSMLFDNGDEFQGNPIGDYVAKIKGLKKGEVHPVYRAFNLLGYDATTVGNHEFNYGLDFLTEALNDAKMPVVNANVYKAGTNTPYFKPYVILNKTVVDDRGNKQTIKVGVIGFVTPQIMEWDKANLEGRVETKSIVESAKKFVPMMKKKGADVIVALAHTGISGEPYQPGMENAAYYLTHINDIDAIFTGHQHNIFPGPVYKDLPNTNLDKGTINGKPVVMAGAFGSHLGLIDLQLQKQRGKWNVVDSKASVRPIVDAAGKSIVETDEPLMNAILPEHEGTINYVNQPVGETTAPIFSYFALVQDDPSIQIVNIVQTDYVIEKLKAPAYSKYAGIPVLSASAPFKAGGRNGPDYYTDIPQGTLAIKNVADLYLYPNTLQAKLVNGAQLKEWLEMSAGQFNQMNPSNTGEQPLINPDFPSFNFDVIDGVQYQIDVTKPAKYDANGNVINAGSSRIVNLTYQGKPIAADQQFIVATNNYRASSTTFPGVSNGEIVLKAPDENRQIITNYIQTHKTINPSADQNWSFAKFKGTQVPVFDSSPNAQKYLGQYPNMKYIGPSSGGFAKFSIDLTE